MLQISNEKLSVTIAPKGAELQSVVRKDLQQEYMWSGDPAFWGKKSPVLFPVVGGLQNNSYTYEGKSYQLGRHGFARDMEFMVTAHTDTSITFTLTDNDETWKVYPFHFRFDIHYSVSEEQLRVIYEVENTGQSELLFSVGGHPAFKVPFTEGAAFDDYYLYFNEAETTGTWPLSPEGMIENMPIPLLEKTHTLPVSKPLFYKDALVFKGLHSTTVTLKSDVSPRGLEMDIEGFPYLGIWSAKDADFICIEPWCGIADHVGTNGKLEDKEGIERLSPDGKFKRDWKVVFF
jgi:galactose mutarotase-like enzyme